MANDFITEYEDYILAALIINPKVRDDIFNCLELYKFSANRRVLFTALKEMYTAKEIIDNVSLTLWLRNKDKSSPQLEQLIVDIVLSSTHTALYKAKCQKLLEIQLNKFIEESKTLEDYEQIKELKHRIDLVKNQESFSQIGKKNNDLNDYYESMARKLLTGYRDLDCVLKGLYPGEFIVVGAATGAGKTAFALNLAVNFAEENSNVLFISLEMSAREIRKRITCRKAGLNSLDIRSHSLTNNEAERYFNTMEEYTNKLPIYINNEFSLSVSNIRTYASNLKDQGKLDVIIIDYLTLVKGSKVKAIREKVIDITNDLKQLALELDIPVISLAQLSRAPEGRDNKRPQLSDLKESSSIEQDADIVMFLYRDDYYNKESTKKGILEVCVAKFRDGAAGNCELYFDKTIQKISNKG